MRIAAFLLALSLSACVEAQEHGRPKAVINGKTTGTAGELITLDASESEGEDLKYLWRVTPEVPGRKLIDVCSDGKKCRIASLPGTWTYTLVVSNSEGADLLFWTVTIPAEPQPNPSPTPTPVPPGPLPNPPTPVPPAPEPDLPDGQFHVARDVRDWAAAVVSPTRAVECTQLADGAEAVAAKAAAGGFGALLPPQLAEAVCADLRVKWEARPAWAQFRASINGRVNELYAAGMLKSPESWAVFLREISQGLRAAAKG